MQNTRFAAKRGLSLMAAIIIVVFAASALLLSGCIKGGEVKASNKDAEDYYNSKYGTSEKVVSTESRHVYNGFSGKSTGTEYQMTDGSVVVYTGEDGGFWDNAQADEGENAIGKLLAQKMGKGAIVAPEIAMVVTKVNLKEDEKGRKNCCWQAKFQGDNLEKLLQEEALDVVLSDDVVEGHSYVAVYDVSAFDSVAAGAKELASLARFEGGDDHTMSNSYLIAFVNPSPTAQDPLAQLDERTAFKAIVDDAGNIEANTENANHRK